MSLAVDPGIGWWLIFVGGYVLLHYAAEQYMQRQTLSREPAVIVRHAKAQPKMVSLDKPKLDAVEALVRDGWKRKAAVSALATNGWKGYPDVSQMVLNAWKTMPGYKK